MITNSLRRVSTNAGEASQSQIRRASTSFSYSSKKKTKQSRSDFQNILDRARNRPELPEDEARKRDVRKITHTNMRIANGMMQGENPKWRHTYDGKKQTSRLKQNFLLRGTRQKVMPSADEEHFLETLTMEDFVQGSTTTSPLQPGTYYEQRRCVVSVIAT